MSITEIKSNIDKLEQKTKEELIENIHELLMVNKRQESKNITLQTEIRYLNKQLTKIKELINKIQNSKIKIDKEWKNNDK
ncbi:MAG: hypothetical protein ACOCP8_01085 [archaeon]